MSGLRNLSHHRSGLTMVELLVVVVVLIVLVALLLHVSSQPSRPREIARQAVCRSNLYQFNQANLMISDDRDGGFMRSGRYEFQAALLSDHLAWVNQPLITEWIEGYNLAEELLQCPSRRNQDDKFDDVGFDFDDDLTKQPAWELGYFCMAGRRTTVDGTPGGAPAFGAVTDRPGGGAWEVPLKYTQVENPSVTAMAADRNELGADTLVGKRSVYPHGREGLIITEADRRPGDTKAVGGNTAFLDGSVRFEKIEDMREYQINSAGSATNRGYWSKDANLLEPGRAEQAGDQPVF